MIISDRVAEKPKIKALSSGDGKIVSKDAEGYFEMLKMLKQIQADPQDPLHDVGYYYQIKSERAFIVMIGGLHYSADTELIALTFKDEGHEPHHVFSMHGFRIINGKKWKLCATYSGLNWNLFIYLILCLSYGCQTGTET